MRRTSEAGRNLIREFEGCSLKAVRLSGEPYYTIGYGHYGADVLPNQQLTREQAEQLLNRDLEQFEAWVNAACKENGFAPNQNQFDGLVSFAYNCGPGSLRQLVRGRTAAQIAAHMLAYTGSASENYREGLLRRRRAERALFLTPVREEELDMTKEELLQVDGTGDHPSGWAEQAAAWAKQNGLMAGNGKGDYGWQQPITREAVAMLLYQFAKLRQ